MINSAPEKKHCIYFKTIIIYLYIKQKALQQKVLMLKMFYELEPHYEWYLLSPLLYNGQ